MEVCVQSENTIQSDITNSKYNTDNIEERSKKSEEDCVISSVDTIPLDIFNTMPSDALPNDQSEQESQSIVGLPSLPSDNDTFGLNSRRKSKRLAAGEHLSCPVCGAKLSLTDMDSHIASELEMLASTPTVSRTLRKRGLDKNPVGGLGMLAVKGLSNTQCGQRYKAFLEVKKSRLIRSRVRKTGPSATCPVCTKTIYGCPEELSEHVDNCLQRQACEERTVVDVGDSGSSGSDEEYEEYTWAGQTRIRATTMLPGGLRGSGFTASTRLDDDTELDVVDDDTHIYGPSQYNEGDMITQRSDDDSASDCEPANATSSLRRATNGERGAARTTSVGGEDNRQTECVTHSETVSICHDSQLSTSMSSASTTAVIEALKSRLRDQERLLATASQIRCHICLEAYVDPLVSILCWHVYCERCWLRTLGAKKLCPQCNTITSPADLRKIFM